MKYNIGDIIVETCYKYEKDYRTGYITNITKHILEQKNLDIITIKWFDIEKEDVYTTGEIDGWISRNNAKHYPVKE
jgi:hypothetical protein